MTVLIKEKFIESGMASEIEVDQKIDTLVGRVRMAVTSTSNATSSTFTKIGNRFLWINSRNTKYQDGILMYSAVIVGYHMNVRIVNTTTGEVLAYSGTITTSGTYTLTFPSPTVDCSIEVQITRGTNVILGTNPSIQDAAIEFTTI